jgi:hypothetical protein
VIAVAWSQPALAASHPGLADPTSNRQLSSATTQACYVAPAGAACLAGAVADLDAARAAEGVGPVSLPGDWSSLTLAQQLLVISNLERVDRGLVPMLGLSARLNGYALQGAEAGEDPPFPNPLGGDAGTANWAGGYPSALEADFSWMYDDGPGSPNIDCHQAGDPGCWGHRDDTLWPFDAPAVMGAAQATSQQYGLSLTELYIGGATEAGPGQADAPLDPTWSAIAQTLPVGLSGTSVSLTGGASSAPLTAWASGEDMNVSAAITAGTANWSVAPSTCTLAAGSTCQLTVTAGPAGRGTTGTLTITGPNGAQTVSLAAQAPSALRLTVAPASIVAGRAAAVTAVLSTTSGPAVAGQTVTLRTSVPGTAGQVVSTATTDAGGTARFRVTPSVNTAYAASFAGTPTLGASSSTAASVGVTPIIRVALAHASVRHGHAVAITGSVTPVRAGRRAVLQLRRGLRWVAAGSARLAPTGRFSFRVVPARPGIARYRVTEAADVANGAAVSPVLALRVR